MRWPVNYKLIIKQSALDKIAQFYKSMGQKYMNTYGFEEIDKVIRNNIQSMRLINNNKLLSEPMLEQWGSYNRVVIGKWHFAIDIKDDNVYVVDACHEQNMANNKSHIDLFEDDLQNPPNRLTNITFPHTPGNPYYVRANVDSEWCGIRRISEKEYRDVMHGKIDPYKIAEKYYAKELAEDRFKMDEFLNKGPKR